MKRSLTVDDYEALTLAKIPVEYRKLEPDLYGSKWFDYKPLHPAEATLLFVRLYEGAIRIAYGKYKDVEASARIKVLPYTDPFVSRDIVSFWTARQNYDRIGCRYEFGLRWTMDRFADRGWSFFPRPNQLYGSEMMLDLADAWRIECSAALQIAKLPFFRVENYTGHHDQDAYRQWLIGQVKARGNGEWRALSRLLSERVVDEAAITGHFTPYVIAKASNVAISMS